MNTLRKLGAAALVALAGLVVTAQPAAAEWFADVYAGASFTEKADVRVNDRAVGIATYRDLDFDTGLAYGLRFGKYFDGAPFIGIGLDGFHFGTTIGPQQV
ncbi:MAG TPA: hypothetical protein VGT02_01590, partial [Methylomirabilota bacterium]|nr:hypothetical protein [Methylomirabilota bacterium]